MWTDGNLEISRDLRLLMGLVGFKGLIEVTENFENLWDCLDCGELMGINEVVGS
jgi:hypothetical protein